MAPLLSLLVIFSVTSSVIATSRTCTVPNGDGTTDDSPAILKVFQECNTDSTIIFSSGVKYNTWSPMYWNNLSRLHTVERWSHTDVLLFAEDVVIELNGSLHLPNNIAAVQAKVKTNKNPDKSWIYIQGTDVSLIGENSNNLDHGAFYGYGQQWWDIGQKVSCVPDTTHESVSRLMH